jgi:hypothetical protein
MAETHKLAAIMAVDVVGYSRLELAAFGFTHSLRS